MDKYSSIVFFEVCQNKNFGIRSRHQVNVKGFFWQSISSKQFLTNQSRTYIVLDTPHRREEGWLEHNTRVSLSPGEQITRITVAASLPAQFKTKTANSPAWEVLLDTSKVVIFSYGHVITVLLCSAF